MGAICLQIRPRTVYVRDIRDGGKASAEYGSVVRVVEEADMMGMYVMLWRLWQNFYGHNTKDWIQREDLHSSILYAPGGQPLCCCFHFCLASRTACLSVKLNNI